MTTTFAPSHAALFGLSALTFLATNTLLVVGVIALAERRLFWPTWRKVVSSTVVFDLLGLPIIALLALSYIQVGKGWLAVIVLALLGWRQLYKKNADLEQLAEDMLHYSVATIEMQDPYTSGHSQRVAAYSRLIARLARIPTKVVDHINTAALLHDVGKIHVEFGPILRKPGRLTDEERRIMETHPVESAKLVNKIGRHRHLIPAIRGHHERWDGKGYPDGLAGQEIPLGARVIALADTIDAMMSSRPYRSAMEISDIRREIERGRGSQFDPKLVDAVLSDVAWQRLSKIIKRYQNLRPGETFAWDEEDQRRFTGDMPVVASR
jgi:putative nucleotidyltransferase with HDIG domain